MPLLVSSDDEQLGDDIVLDEFTEDIWIAYSFGPPYGERLVSWADLDRNGVGRRTLRRGAIQNLGSAMNRIRISGQPPALMLSFGGLESSVLLIDEFWDDLSRSVPGELVVGVPARDVVIVTGSQSRPGREKARRAVDRVFFAGDPHLLSRDLLVWRQGLWLPFHPAAPAPGPVRRSPQQSSAPPYQSSAPPQQLALPSYRPPAQPYRPSAPPYQPPPEPEEPPYRPPVEPPYQPPAPRAPVQAGPKVRWSESPQPEDLEELEEPERRTRRPKGRAR
jgi:hypothetical protein